MMHQELVEKRRWISEHRFLHALNFTMLLPGPEAQQLATYIGWLLFGVRGGIVSGVLFILPSLFILMALSWIYLNFNNVVAVESILYGIKPAVTAIVVFAAYRIGSKALANKVLKGLAVLAFIAIFVFKVPFPYIVLTAAVIGYLGAHLSANIFTLTSHHNNSKQNYGAALIDDDTPIPEHAKFKLSKLIGFFIIGTSLWFGLMSLLTNAALYDMGIFFSKAAVVTFGGAYAVLPYVYQGAVEQFGWLSATQMIDGLALGETTPGPLIMVVAFVAFVGAWNNQIFGADALLLAGFISATVVTIVTFLPSFLFIFLAAPSVEATRGDLKFSAPLSAITAAVVGVILNLAVFFAYHTLWPNGLNGNFEMASAVIGLIAFIALFRFKVGIVTVIISAAMAGLALGFLP